MKKFLLEQSLAIRTSLLPAVKTTIVNVGPEYDNVKPYQTDIVKWLSPIIDLSEFYVYPANGITEGINWWYNREVRGIWREPGEYQWVDNRGSCGPYIQYKSIPSSIDGNFDTVPNNISIALDLAYVGSTAVKKINIHKNVEFVFYSLSKSFGVRNIRTGWIFTRKLDKKLEDLTYGAKYYNYFANTVAETIINNFDIDYIHKQLDNQQRSVCKKLDLTPSDSVWLATTTNAEYSKFRRKDNIARICLAGVYNYEEKTSITHHS